LTGRRLVSLPFSDHCEPLVRERAKLETLVADLERQSRIEGCRYAELRPVTGIDSEPLRFSNTSSFILHRLDLRPHVDDLFRRLHPSCVQRKIRRAARERLTVEVGLTNDLIASFYRLFVRTRRRHGIPPQPLAWFRDLAGCLGNKMMAVRLASKDGRPVAGIVTLRYKRTLTYKYAASDEQFHSTGAMAHLLWGAIQEAKELGLEELDLGRSDLDNAGLVAFKDHWGATRSTLQYWRSTPRGLPDRQRHWSPRLAHLVLAHLPNRLFTLTGNLLYRHMG
jgi:hypothetical protein